MANPGTLPNLNVANVYTTLSNATIYTDKVRLATGNTHIHYNVYAVALGTANAIGNIYSANPQIPANSTRDVYVGSGNKMTVIGANWTATEIGTASSATSGVIGAGSG